MGSNKKVRRRKGRKKKVKPKLIANIIISVDGKTGKTLYQKDDDRVKEEKIKLYDKLDQERTNKLWNEEVDAVIMSFEKLKEILKEENENRVVDLKENKEKEDATNINEENGEDNYRKLIIIDAKGELFNIEKELEESKFLKDKKLIIAISDSLDRRRIMRLKKEKKSELLVIGKYTVNLHELMRKLYRRGMRKILLEEEGKLLKRMLQEEMIDELYVMIAPILIGCDGENLITENLNVSQKKKLELAGITQYGDKVLLHYYLS